MEAKGKSCGTGITRYGVHCKKLFYLLKRINLKIRTAAGKPTAGLLHSFIQELIMGVEERAWLCSSRELNTCKVFTTVSAHGKHLEILPITRISLLLFFQDL